MSISALIPLAVTAHLAWATPAHTAMQTPAEAPPAAPRSVPTVGLDPENPFPIKGWWSNGAQMLEVGEDGAYRLYDSTNRYRKPLEVGRWHRQNHAAFWLEPYTMRKEERTRVPLSISDEQVVIVVRKYAPMTFIVEAPLAAEDLFVGLWQGDGGTLELLPTMRYHYVAPKAPGAEQPVVISSHRGEWRLHDGRVELLPDSPSVTALLLEPESDDAATGGEQVRAKEHERTKPTGGDAKTGTDNGKTSETASERDEADAPPTFNRLRSVEGVLHRIVERPSVGPGDAASPEKPAAEKPAPVTNPTR